MSVHVVADTPAKLSATCALLEHKYPVTSELLGTATIEESKIDAIVVNADLRLVENISALKAVSGKLSRVRKRVFLLNERSRLVTVQAYALGATHTLATPIKPADLLAKIADRNAPSIAPNAPGSTTQEVASACVASIASMFSAVVSGSGINVVEARCAGSMVADSVAENGLSDWLTTVRRHHEGTYQHCLLVTGIAVDFGLSLGMGNADIERLHSAAIFHDIGKATIPLALLDKPAKLDDQERALIQTHAAAGYDVLKGLPGISSEILDAVRHHHEFLDGSGYPDGLCAESISDIVRILTISDIFAALIEQRPYKPAMPRAKAYDILLDMDGKLERPLVGAFREVALSR
jgi:putative nucleotidyltransferase with HDIG domain